MAQGKQEWGAVDPILQLCDLLGRPQCPLYRGPKGCDPGVSPPLSIGFFMGSGGSNCPGPCPGSGSGRVRAACCCVTWSNLESAISSQGCSGEGPRDTATARLSPFRSVLRNLFVPQAFIEHHLAQDPGP
jgi:hypothetical protein